MKLFSLLAVLLWFFCVTSARAQSGPDDQFVTIYSEIQQADALADGGQPRLALADYTAAQSDLQKFAHVYPEWNPNIITYRLHYLADKISGLTAQLPAPAAPAVETTAPLATMDAAVTAQMQSLQAENATLAAKLKEALTAQPAAVDPQQLAAAQDQIVALTKANDLLQASLAEAGQKPPTGKKSRLQMEQLQERIKTLEARLAADEAQPAPYTTEEQALFQPASPMPAAPVTPPLVNHQLPAGSDDLVASAKSHFAAHEYDLAAADYEKVLKLDEHNAYVMANLAVVELRLGHLADAEKHINAAVAQNPNDPFYLSVAGNLEFQQENYDAALDTLSKAAQLDPQNPEIESLLGVSLAHKGLRLPAETALRKALLADPEFGAAHYNLALVYIGEQPPRPELARWHYLKALAAGQPHNASLEKMLADNGAAVPAQ